MKLNAALIEQLREELNRPLPGEVAQYRMAPSYRPRLSEEEIRQRNPRVSGVMLLLYEKNNSLHIVFTQRKTYEGVHSGQMSFPGGKQESGDLTLVHTALRETYEEVGVKPDAIEIIGRLSHLYIPPSNFLVHPSVGFSPAIEEFIPQPQEVEKVVEIPVAFFLDSKNINLQTEIKLFNNTTVRVPAYIYNRHIIWGATAIMLSEFTFILEKIVSPKP
ncbi:MAG: CoA pyrophosphatase [Chitinophagales bacterium]